MTRDDLLHGIKKAVAKAETILEESRARQDRIRRKAEESRQDILKEMSERTDEEIATLEQQMRDRVNRLREENTAVGKEKAEAMKRGAMDRMPDLVDELVVKFKEKAEPGSGR